MLRFDEKRTFRRYLYSRPSLAILGILILFVSHAVYGVYGKAQSAGAFLSEAEDKLAAMKKREAYFAGEMERLNSEMGVEEEIRKKFQVAKEGEKVIVIMDEDKNATTSVVGKKKSLWQRILSVF